MDSCDLADYGAESLEGVWRFDVYTLRAREWPPGMVGDDKIASDNRRVDEISALLGLSV